MSGIRKPAVSGKFYPGTEERLKEQIEDCFHHEYGPGDLPEVDQRNDLIGLVSPHAGYPYSGPVAANGFYELAKSGKPETVIILGPNHSGMGAEVAFDDSEKWETPLGEVNIDTDLREEIISNTEFGRLDSIAHNREHSLEVQIPFLQYLFRNDFQIVPICMKDQNYEICKKLGNKISQVCGEKDVIIGSSDMTHYESPEIAKERDKEIIEKMKEMDAKGVNEKIRKENHSVCGYGPITTTIIASKKLGGDKSELYKYATSGDIGGPSKEVVGYCSIGYKK